MSRILRLPEHGRLIVGTDLQGNLDDFRQLVRHFRDAGPDAVLLLTGDMVHGPDEATVTCWPDHLGTPYVDESPALVEAFIEEQRRAPGRVWCLLGNHDHAHVGGPSTPKFHRDERAVLERRLGAAGTARMCALFRTFPLVAVGACGVVATHAAPAAPIQSPEDVESLQLEGYSDWSIRDFLALPVLGTLLWARGAHRLQADRFLRALGGTVSIYGHDIVPDGFEREGEHQLCFSTSFGLYDTDKVYLDLDLAARYPDAASLVEGREILSLW